MMNTRYRLQGIACVLFGILGLVLATVIVLRRDWLSADAPEPALLRYAVLAAFFDLPVMTCLRLPRDSITPKPACGQNNNHGAVSSSTHV